MEEREANSRNIVTGRTKIEITHIQSKLVTVINLKMRDNCLLVEIFIKKETITKKKKKR